MTPPPSDSDPLRDSRFDTIRARLKEQPAPEPTAGFTDRVMASVSASRRRRRMAASGILRAAAAAALLVSVYVIHTSRERSDPFASLSPVEILMAAQRTDGGWSADEVQARPRYDTGVTALAVLALIHSDPSPMAGARGDAIRAGVAHLVSQQAPDGRLGADFSGSDFTHYLAAKALESATRLPGADPAWGVAAHRARLHLPTETRMAKLNHHLAHPAAFPSRWAEAGGPAAKTAIGMLAR